MEMKSEYMLGFDTYVPRTQETLKEKNGLMLIEQKTERDYLGYSKYLVYDMVYNVSYITIVIPDPIENDLYKTIFLKYQNGVRRFLTDFFDVLTEEKEDIDTIYSIKQEKDLEIEVDNIGKVSTVIKMVGDKCQRVFGIIHWFGEKQEGGAKFAENFVNLFEGQPVEYSWKELADLILSRRDPEWVNRTIGESDGENNEG